MLTKISMVAVAAAVTLSGTAPSWAADTTAATSAPAAASGPLAPGQAAGVSRAEMMTTDNTLYVVGGLAIIGVGVALIANNGGHASSATSSTGTGAR